jgi:ferredoxin
MMKKTNEIGHIFDGIEVNTTSCTQCGTCRYIFENFRFLNCPVADERVIFPIIIIRNNYNNYDCINLKVSPYTTIDTIKHILIEQIEVVGTLI